MSRKNNNKVITKDYWQQMGNPMDDSFGAAVPVLIFNDKNQFAMIIQDNAPVWRVFGNGFVYGEMPTTNKKVGTHYQPVTVLPQSVQKLTFKTDGHNKRLLVKKSTAAIRTKKSSNKGIYFDQAVNILGRETNLPINLREKIVPVMNYRLNLDNKRTERNRVFAVNIGDFPLVSKKGAFIDWFDLDQIPLNTNSNHGEIVKLYAEQQKDVVSHGVKGQKEFLTTLDAPHLGPKNNRHLSHLDDAMANGGEIAGLQKWREQPSVVAKRAAGTLSRDPQ